MLNHLLRDFGKYAASRPYQAYLTAWGPGEESTLEGAGAVFGDYMAYTTPSAPENYVVTIDDSGVATIASSGDEDWAYFSEDLYSITLRSWTGSVVNYVNPHAPALFNPAIESVTAYVATGAALSVDFAAQFTDVDATDDLTYSVSPYSEDAIPSPAAIDADTGVLGTTAPGSAGVHNILVRATDIAGLYAELLLHLVVGDVVVPDVDDPGTSAAEAAAAIGAVYLTTEITYAYSDTIPEGNVISQSPAAGTSVTPPSTVSIVVSLGSTPSDSVWMPFKVVRKFPEVIRVYNKTKAGRFYELVRAGPLWTRKNHNGAASGWQNTQIDITSIPGVPSLRPSGRPR